MRSAITAVSAAHRPDVRPFPPASLFGTSGLCHLCKPGNLITLSGLLNISPKKCPWRSLLDAQCKVFVIAIKSSLFQTLVSFSRAAIEAIAWTSVCFCFCLCLALVAAPQSTPVILRDLTSSKLHNIKCTFRVALRSEFHPGDFSRNISFPFRKQNHGMQNN